MVLYILDQSFNAVGTIDKYISLIWRPAYYDIGDFELYIHAKADIIALLQSNYYLVRADDITVENNKTTFKNVMIIKNFRLSTSVENGDYYTVTGRELKYLLHQRIIWNQTNLAGTVEDGIRQLVNENAITPIDPNRIIPNLILSEALGLTDSIEKQITGDYLDEAIVDICKTYNYGWDMYISDNNFIFNLYTGLDRSYGQSERPYVIFSPDFDNLFNTDYEKMTEDYANTTLIGGEGEGTERTYTAVGADNAGLNRYELFTDARDLSSNKDSEEAIPQAQYIELLKERGAERLAEVETTEGFSGEILSSVQYVYRKDFFIGDIVTVKSGYGITRNTRILSAIESDSETGVTLIPQFNL